SETYLFNLLLLFSFFLMIPPPPTSTLFPYTTLFRSLSALSVPLAPAAISQTVTDEAFSSSRHAVEASPPPTFFPHNWIRGYTELDRKSTRLNSSHVEISYAVFCLKKKKKVM